MNDISKTGEFGLVYYDNARKALEKAKSVDEVKNIRDKAEAMRVYARQAGDVSMKNAASEICIRAERRLGEMLKEQRESGQMNRGSYGKGNQYLKRSHDETAPKLSDVGISKSLSSRAQAIASIPEQKFEAIIEEHKEQERELYSATMYKMASGKPHVSNNSGENEWYTPAKFIESARLVMGSIDVDPASSVVANKTVKAKIFYTEKENGLERKWSGNVWLNPPYSQPEISEFCSAVKLKVESKEIKQAIVLVNNATETAWFRNLVDVGAAICFPSGRIKFIDKYGNPSGAPLQGQALIYIGDSKKTFCSEFKKYGFVAWIQ